MNEVQDSNRLRWRCRRGMHELDSLLMRFVDTRYDGLAAPDRAAFRSLLTLPDPDILGLLTGHVTSEDPAINRVVALLLDQRIS